MTQPNKKFNPNDPYNRHGTRHETRSESGAGKVIGIVFAAIAIAAIGAAALYLMNSDKTKEARLPSVEVTKVQIPPQGVHYIGTKSFEVKVRTLRQN